MVSESGRGVRYRVLRRAEARVFVRSVRAAWSDELWDWAAALTYYSMLSVFPALLITLVLLSVAGPEPGDSLAGAAGRLGPDGGTTLLADSVRHLQAVKGLSGPMAVVGLLSAVWTVTTYVGAFIRAANALYGVQESRSMWRTLPLRLLLSVVMVCAVVVTVLGFVVTPGVAAHAGELVGVGSAGLVVWSIVKWPLLALLVGSMLALLYGMAPNVHGQRFRWLTAGSLIAVLVWIAGSAGLSIYAAHFGSFNRVYGSLAAAVIFLMWLWLTNFAVLLGAAVDAQVVRERSLREAREHPESESQGENEAEGDTERTDTTRAAAPAS
ncbi:YihY/virulence factor BrkB family protein [Nocardia blacklockiae]|uniref:YihY/virulence factor BrkB family protein n=1 Tax=Nocardia blacklockiae TaxID=480036 RepID=UPI001895E8B4|nr:YihY/virulence factor BrkB family protein [Nocardia blacklockiae]MBF6175303.1 YihY/virulence factor BrkB family protein [Nocardia blacklockiae]